MATITKASSPLSSTQFKQRKKVTLPGMKSEDFILTANCRIINVGGRVTMTTTELPEQSGGSYAWTTGSGKIKLLNAKTQLATVEALNTPSSARDAEVITVTRTGSDGKKVSKTVQVTVAKVTFSSAAAQSNGYDDFDTPADPADDHMCVKSRGSSVVKVTIEGGAIGTDFDFVCEPANICTPEPPSGAATFDLRLNAQRHQKAQTALLAKVKCPSAAVFAKLAVHVYTEKVVKVLVAKVFDRTSPISALVNPAVDYAAHQAPANDKLKEAVVRYEITNFCERPAATHVAFDADHNGAVSYDLNAADGGPEVAAIAKAITGDPDQYRVVIVRSMKTFYYLSWAARVGDTSLMVRGSRVLMSNNMPLGTGATKEVVSVVNTAGNVAYLAAPLTHAHPVGAPLEFPAAGVSGDLAHPVIIEEGGVSVNNIIWTILHEVGHSALKLNDIVDPTNFMHYTQEGITGDCRLRYCPRIVLMERSSGGSTTENQWEKIPRPAPAGS